CGGGLGRGGVRLKRWLPKRGPPPLTPPRKGEGNRPSLWLANRSSLWLGRDLLHSLRRLDLHRTDAVAAVAVGTIHVLHIGLRQHVFARRDGAHDVGDGEHRLVAAGPVEG